MEHTTSITYSRTSLGADSFWAHMIEKEIAIDPNAVTSAEAAEIIDAVYEIKACGTEEEQESASTGGESNIPVFESWEEYEERMAGAFVPVYDPCNNVYTDNSYSATLHVYLSDMTKPYKLNLSNADVVQTAVVTKLVNETYPINSDRLTVDLPIQGSLTCSAAVQDNNSKTILFTQHLIGAVTVQYETKYYEVLVNVKSIDGERSNCLCLLFYQETVNEVSISPPDIDEEGIDALNCAPATNSESGQDPYEPIEHEESDCYLRYIHAVRCRCSPYKSLGTWNEVRQVPCSVAFSAPTPDGVYNSFQEAVRLVEYIPCPNIEDWEGGTDEFYIENCCVPPPPDLGLPVCQETKRTDYGGQEIIHGPDFHTGNALTNQIIKLVPVNPKDGICGEITYVQDVEGLNCCDDPLYEDIILNEDNSVEVIADLSTGYVYWEKGIGTYEVSVRGSGFYLDYLFTTQEASTTNNFIQIYTDDACGACIVTITDGCTEVSHIIRSTDGSWVQISTGCPAPGIALTDVSGPITTEPGWTWGYHYYSADRRLRQFIGSALGNRGTAELEPCVEKCYQELSYAYVTCTSYDANYCLEWKPTDIGYDDDGCHDGCGFAWFTGPEPPFCWYATRTKLYDTPIIQEWKC